MLRYIVVFLVVPNVLAQVAAHLIYLYRPLINLDYLAVGALVPWLGASLRVLALSLVILADAVTAFGPTFHFTFAGLLQSLKDIFALDGTFLVATSVLALSAIVATSVLLSRFLGKPHRGKVSAGLLGLFVLFFVADQLPWEHVSKIPVFRDLPERNVSVTPMGKIAQTTYWRVRYGDMTENVQGPVQSASAALFANAGVDRTLPHNIVLVLVESLGRFKLADGNELLNQALAGPELQSRYWIEHGSVTAVGSTVPGEIRELCRLRAFALGYTERKSWMTECLPARLQRAGYQTLAIHGFVGSFFERQLWYPWMGFDQVMFARDFWRISGSRKTCGGIFPGACDTDIGEWVRSYLQSEGVNQRRFIYWLTLNAHLPLQNLSHRPADGWCHDAKALASDAVCLHTTYHRLVLEKIRDVAADPALPPTMFIVVGDHTPPFVTVEERNQYESERVPYWILLPKANSATRSPGPGKQAAAGRASGDSQREESHDDHVDAERGRIPG